MKKTLIGGFVVLMIAGTVVAGPFTVRGGSFGTDSQSEHGLRFMGGEIVASSGAFMLGNGAVAPFDEIEWGLMRQSPEVLEGATWLGLYPGERPSDWSMVSSSPGGRSIGFGGLAKWRSNHALYDFAWARLDLGPVDSAPANIIGPGEYVWFGQMVSTDPFAMPGGDVTVIFNGHADRAVLNGAPARDPSGQQIFLISVETAPGVHQLYLTDVKPKKKLRGSTYEIRMVGKKEARKHAMLWGLPRDAFPTMGGYAIKPPPKQKSKK